MALSLLMNSNAILYHSPFVLREQAATEKQAIANTNVVLHGKGESSHAWCASENTISTQRTQNQKAFLQP